MKVNDGGSVHWQPGRNQGVRQQTSDLPKESFVSGGNDWVPVKPNVTSAVNTKPSAVRNFTGAMTLALGLALTLGMTGCASVATAQSTQKTPIVQTQTKAPQDAAGKQSPSYQIGKGLHEIGKGTKEAAQPAIDKGAEIGKEIGKTGAQVGREIGKAGKSFGQAVGNEAKSFWRGITGDKE